MPPDLLGAEVFVTTPSVFLMPAQQDLQSVDQVFPGLLVVAELGSLVTSQKVWQVRPFILA